ncbi:uncharacterized protein LOC124818955 [Hydra vulgaris]|uniref:uncharacterized protein LOC124818955 n=1 Tax=Hydra vulgaris TaxID=6087 RepID=UPI000192443B|nr:uncharacterized protein LOC124818955 [Hydra vulgaris]
MKVIFNVVLLFVVAHGLDKLIRDYETCLKTAELVATIPVLAMSYKVSFDLKPKSYSYGFHSVLHFAVGNDTSEIGDRALALWLRPYEPNYKGFHITAPINGKRNREIYIDAPPLNVWTHVVISQQRIDDKYVFTIDVNGTNAFSENNANPQKFENVKVFASDPWYPSQDGSIKNLILENGEPGESLAKAVLKSKYFVDNEVEETLKKNNLVAVLSKLEQSFDIYFDLKLNSFSNGFRSVIHLTKGEDNSKYGDRIPGIWIFDRMLHLGFAINNEKNEVIKSKPLQQGQWINIHIRQHAESGRASFTLYINNENVYTVQNFNPQVFTNVKVYAGDPWYEAQDGSIKMFNVINGYLDGKKEVKKDAIRKKAFRLNY